MIGDGTGTPDGSEAQRVCGELHVLNGGGAGGVVLQRLDLVAAAFADNDYHDRRPERLFALTAYPASGELLFFALGLGLNPRHLGAGASELATSLAGKYVEAPGFGDPVVRRVDGALEDLLYDLPGHRTLLNLQRLSLLILVRSGVF